MDVFLIWFFIFGFFTALVFLVYLVFGFFYAFLMFFWIFLRFFFWSSELVLLTKKGTIFCNSLAIYFFWSILTPLGGGDPQKVTAQSFAALGLVFNRICKSIKKYKTVMLGFFKASTFTGCMNDFLRFYLLKPYGIAYVNYHL